MIKTILLFCVILLVTALMYSQTDSNDNMRQVIDRAVNEMVKTQEPDGAWPYEGVYRVAGKIPVGYRIGL
jgi:hypothetical protein